MTGFAGTLPTPRQGATGEGEMRATIGFAILLGSTLAALAADPPSPAPAPSSEEHPTVRYQPPDRGAPANRVGAATRGMKPHLVQVLAPDHVGLTLREQPVLYWFNEARLGDGVQLVIRSAATDEAILDTILRGPFEPGIHAVRLADFGTRLVLDGEYRWSVTPLNAPKAGSVASIQRISRAKAEPVRGNDPRGATRQLAAAGIWYDALDASAQASPLLRAELLEQVGLRAAADASKR
jgi:hypothetical protein